MLWFLIGQVLVYTICWAIVVLMEPQLGATFQPWLFLLGIPGELILLPLLDGELSKPLADGLSRGRISRWLPFAGGFLGAFSWVGATVITWWVSAHFRSSLVFTLAIGLTILWVAAGVGGALAFVAELAKPPADALHCDDGG